MKIFEISPAEYWRFVKDRSSFEANGILKENNAKVYPPYYDDSGKLIDIRVCFASEDDYLMFVLKYM